MARSSRSSVAAISLAVLAATVSLSAHRRDEYLQAARIAIDFTNVRVELDLTPGISVADDVLSHIDRDGDGSISSGEAAGYVNRIVEDVALEMDGTPLAPRVVGHSFPPPDAMRRGEGTIRLDLTAALPRLAPGVHRLRYRNLHRGDIGVYMANTLVPVSDFVRVTDQWRDVDQRSLDVSFALDAPSEARYGFWMLIATAAVLVGAAGVCVLRSAARSIVGFPHSQKGRP